jgi:glycosyltransferase involved in cell wall biosynthesis
MRLTVGIPTYNREADLCVAIESALALAGGRFRGELEILVSDNASTDGTRAAAERYAAAHPGVVAYRCNPTNLGFSRNVDAVIRHARGEYVLILGDDDGLEPCALETLGEILDACGPVGAVFLSERNYDAELKEPLANVLGHKRQSGGELYSPGLAYIRRARVFPPFLVSGYVVRREAWLAARPEEFFDSICVHTLVTLRIMQAHAVYASYVPAVKYRMENKGGNRWRDELYPFTFHLNLLIGCKGVRDSYPADLLRILHRQAMRSIALNIMTVKAAGEPLNAPLVRERLRQWADLSDPLSRLCLLLLRMPAWALRAPRRAGLWVKRLLLIIK